MKYFLFDWKGSSVGTNVRKPFSTRSWKYASNLSSTTESYREDFELAEQLDSDSAKTELYMNLKSGAESGWDYSTKWWV